jgi:hypothetical protein
MEFGQVQPVEISGWDAEGQFFVEIADMDVNENVGSSVRLCHRVHSGSLLFVRPVINLGGADQKGHPVANEAQMSDLPDVTGRSKIRLSPCQPRNLRGRR